MYVYERHVRTITKRVHRLFLSTSPNSTALSLRHITTIHVSVVHAGVFNFETVNPRSSVLSTVSVCVSVFYGVMEIGSFIEPYALSINYTYIHTTAIVCTYIYVQRPS